MGEHEHEGSFAEGQEETEHHPEREAHSDFAGEGEGSQHRHEGSFAEGEEETEHHPESEHRGTFAEGLEDE